ncbi:PREDICTED: disintegrin and metalloproteinase domain-containing protein 20 [Chinchilla lanigera]|uniref:disintegrin and metalloproteinase domain-containing protein 20 n=1 Tax=Chinchilla lanigera TaxID=34839 RepID=UPI00038F101E|nr:PREDICTED: disintegrin and metalloproteinase domain-containing protein 20 [Chinchilla lanigera]XP_005412265.1 PREDICTED: disintegrin and metalloproteinase domain-containing protein 20 [Chinchilla lanigera]XP_005412266.1 PREDICTED: disintegrin and metalloproteinase domain-containing protein 20 [Chinchilla lanigera]
MMTVSEALMYVRITPQWLWLGVFLFLSGWPQAGHSQYSSPPEVVIPLQVTGTGRGMSPPGWLSYSLHFGGQRHIVHMKAKKLLMSRHLPVFTYTDEGVLLEDYPFVPDDCYYHGYVEGNPESMVALSTCFGGFYGTLQINDIAYEIEPKEYSLTFEHLVYKMASEETQSPLLRCGLSDKKIAQQLKLQESDNYILMQSGYLGWWIHTWLLDLGLVVDHQRFVFLGRNNSRVMFDILNIVNQVNFLLKSMGINVLLTGLDIWDKSDLVPISDDMPAVLEAFRRWKIREFDRRVTNDLGHLLSHQIYKDGYLGLAYVGTTCNTHYNSAVDRVHSRSLQRIAHTVAHELGHNLGMSHDEIVGPCACEQPVCIMAAFDNHSTKFSNCSYSVVWKLSYAAKCVRTIPTPLDLIRGILPPPRKYCGNRMVEQGEECDCGTVKLCAEDPCCFPNCTLIYGAQCASGLCCKECMLMPSGSVCREQSGECDLPEWCNGTSQECPNDVYVLDGMSCPGSGHCYEKKCVIRDEQCRQIFGQQAKSANQTCYMAINSQGDRFGNCGNNSQEYLKCSTSDILCGRVQCENVTEIPSLSNHTTVRCSQIQGTFCWGTDYHFGMTGPDIGGVKDGTFCADKNICIKQRCVTMPLWTSNCSPETCNMSGICNNKNHCHCDYGWSPPNCMTKGNGGSVDSGPPPYQPPKKTDSTKNYGLLFPLIFFILLLLILILLALLRKMMKTSDTPEQNVQTDTPEQNVQTDTPEQNVKTNIPEKPVKTHKK